MGRQERGEPKEREMELAEREAGEEEEEGGRGRHQYSSPLMVVSDASDFVEAIASKVILVDSSNGNTPLHAV